MTTTNKQIKDFPKTTVLNNTDVFLMQDTNGNTKSVEASRIMAPATEIVNDPTTGGTNKALSAEAGKNINKKVEENTAQLEHKANHSTTDNIQRQVDNLVLNGDGTQNLEVVQARDIYTTINNRITDIQQNIMIKTGNLLDVTKGILTNTAIINWNVGTSTNQSLNTNASGLYTYPIIYGLIEGKTYNAYSGTVLKELSGVGFYDANGVSISFSTKRDFTIPVGCKSVRFTANANTVTQFKMESGQDTTTEIFGYKKNVYTINETDEKLQIVKNDINNLGVTKISNNLLDESKILDKTCIKNWADVNATYDSLITTGVDTYRTSPVITVEEGNEYVILDKLGNKISALLSAFGEDTKQKKYFGSVNTIQIPIGSGYKYIRFSVNNISFAQFKLSASAVDYEKFGQIPNFLKKEDTNKDNTYKMTYIYVAKTGNDTTGDGSIIKPYATIYKANSMILDNSKYNRYTIIVKNGTYTDLQEKYNGTFSGKYEGVICKDYVYYESEDINRPDLCVINWDGSIGFGDSVTEAQIVDKTPFHIIGNINGIHTHIKGFTFNCVNTRYAMHIETQSTGLNVEWLIENCILNWGGRPKQSGATSTPCIGTGSSMFEKGKIKRCVINNTQSGNTLGFQNHDNNWNYGYNPFANVGANITIEECNFNNTDIQLRSIHQINYNIKNTFNVINCYGIKRLFKTNTNTTDLKPWVVNIQSSDIVTNEF